MSDISSEAQKEVARIRDMISTTKALLPNGNVSWAVYETVLEAAEKAIREQDGVVLVQILLELKEMH